MNPVKITQLIATTLAGLLAARALEMVWRKIFGHKPSLDPDNDDDVTLREVVLFAAVSGAVSALAQVVARRAATKFVSKSLDSTYQTEQLEA